MAKLVNAKAATPASTIGGKIEAGVHMTIYRDVRDCHHGIDLEALSRKLGPDYRVANFGQGWADPYRRNALGGRMEPVATHCGRSRPAPKKGDLIAPKQAFHYSAKFRRWLAGLSPRDELIARMAVRDDIRDQAAAKKWEARIAELQGQIIKTEADWASLLPAVQRAKREIAGNGQTQSPPRSARSAAQ